MGVSLTEVSDGFRSPIENLTDTANQQFWQNPPALRFMVAVRGRPLGLPSLSLLLGLRTRSQPPPFCEKEINHIKQDFPNFRFKCPSKSQVTSNKTFLDRSESELNKIQGMLEMLDGDESIRRLLTEHLKKKGDLQ